MLGGHRYNKYQLLSASVGFLKDEGYKEREIKASLGRYERPGLIFHHHREKGFFPDIMVTHNDRDLLFEIELDKKQKLEKWRTFARHASNHDGRFFIITPEKLAGRTGKILKKNKIDAEIIEITK